MRKEVRKYNKVVRHLNPFESWEEALRRPLYASTGKSLAAVLGLIGAAMGNPGEKAYILPSCSDKLRGHKGVALAVHNRQRVEYYWHLVLDVINKLGLVGLTVNRAQSYLVYAPIGKVEVSTQTVYTVKE